MIKENSLRRSTILLLLLVPLLSLSQTSFRVTGKVHDDAGKPVSGATIAVKGTNIATTSGEDGGFTIDAPSGKSVLLVSFVGYEQQEIDINNRSSITATITSTQK